MPFEAPSAHELARRLVAREAAKGDAQDTAAAPSHAACERAYRGLARWLGANGRDALFTRALAQARAGHPALEQVRLHVRSDPALEGVPESTQAHGASAVAAGLDALLVALFELLGRLVGDDVATRLVDSGMEQHRPTHERDSGRLG